MATYMLMNGVWVDIKSLPVDELVWTYGIVYKRSHTTESDELTTESEPPN